MKIYAIILVLISFILISCTRQSMLTKEEVTAVIEKFDEGWEHKKMGAVDSSLAKDYTYFTQSGGIFSRDSVVATAGEADYILNNMSRSDLDIIIYDNTAIVSTRWRGKGMYRGTAFDEDQRCSIVVLKKDGKVQILSEHCTPIRTNRIFH